MIKSIKSFCLIAMVFFFSCAGTIPPPKPQDPVNSSAIGISIVERAPLRFIKNKPESVYFIKMDETGDLFTQTLFIRSTYAKGSHVYLLNAKPGRYAVVASERIVKDSGTYTAFFSKELIQQTEVTVSAGEMAFMGEYEIDTSGGMGDKADSAQDHYYRHMKAGKTKEGGFMGLLFSGESYSRATIHKAKRDEEAEMNFLSKAKKHFAEVSGWLDIIERKLTQISGK